MPKNEELEKEMLSASATVRLPAGSGGSHPGSVHATRYSTVLWGGLDGSIDFVTSNPTTALFLSQWTQCRILLMPSGLPLNHAGCPYSRADGGIRVMVYVPSRISRSVPVCGCVTQQSHCLRYLTRLERLRRATRTAVPYTHSLFLAVYPHQR